MKHETERYGNPFTLFVKKKPLPSDEPLADWRKRVLKAQQVISGTDIGARKEVLRDDFSENFFETRLAKEVLGSPSARQPLAATAANAGTTRPAESKLAGERPAKRAKPDIIDLT